MLACWNLLGVVGFQLCVFVLFCRVQTLSNWAFTSVREHVEKRIENMFTWIALLFETCFEALYEQLVC